MIKIINKMYSMPLVFLFIFCWSVILTGVSALSAKENKAIERNNSRAVDVDRLNESVLLIEKEIYELNQEITNLTNNLSIFLVNQTESFDVTYLELEFKGNILFKKEFSDLDNSNISKEVSGLRIGSAYFFNDNDKKSSVNVNCFYKKKGEDFTRVKKIVKSFDVDRNTLSLLTIDLFKKNTDLGDSVVALDLTYMFDL